MSSLLLIIGILLVCLLVMGGIGALVFWGFSRARTPGELADSAFMNAPVAHAVVTERKYARVQVGGSRKYHVTYQVHTPDGFSFVGWQDLYLPWTRKAEFDVGTQHPVAYLPTGQTSQVRALPAPPPAALR